VRVAVEEEDRKVAAAGRVRRLHLVGARARLVHLRTAQDLAAPLEAADDPGPGVGVHALGG